jgi:hypothetical protein|tara:strand:+ start:166 stop:1020 length:855 start_codon:yes stop_codon:yes gene_type:complete
MALTISNSFITLFDSEVKQAYQASRSLAGLTREKNNVVGQTISFPKLGKGVATIRTPQSDVTPLSLSYTNVTATMTNYIAAEYSDIFNQTKVNFNDRSELVQAVGGAIGRRMDQVTIDALVAASGTGTVANTIAEDGSAGSASDLNTGKIRAAKKALDAANVGMEGRTLLVHANNLSALLGQTTVQSSDYNSIKSLVSGELNTWLGFNVVTIGDRDEDGLAIDGSSDRVCYAFHKSAIGVGMGMGQKTSVDYIPEKTSWLVASMFTGTGVAIDAPGIVKITCRE